MALLVFDRFTCREILGLRWQDVDFLNRSLRIQQAAYRGSIGSPKTKGSKRTLPLPESLLEALRPSLRRFGRSGMVWYFPYPHR